MVTQEVNAPTIDDIADRNIVSVAVLMTPPMKSALKKFAEDRDQSTMEFARKVLADAIGFELPVSVRAARTSKYASLEEKEAATKAKAKERRDLIKNLLKQYEQSTGGDSDGDDS